MKCIKCDKKAIISYPVRFCKEHFIEYYLNKLKETIEKWGMFNKEDKILVTVSGGKDSSSLAYALHLLGYEFEGLYINLEIPNYSNFCEEKVKELFKLINKKLNIIRVSDYGLRVERVRNRPRCSVCGTIKRYLMNRFAYENGFTVLATAHTMPDEVSFFFMNLRSGNLNAIVKQKPVLEGKGKFVKKVKPLIYFTEKENLTFSLINNLPVCRLECPYATGNTQNVIKNKIYEIDKEFRGLFNQTIHFLEKINIEVKDEEVYECIKCGYPTSSKDIVCSFCKIKEYFSKNPS
ncbi:adenine nucleotide alpha hydrolase family protein [Nanoarchaeota archaeon NZ13-N]|nr:MAG: adenine nucleotide alpha hydrolase family protein [Nanoarchaeota archaeon NZ13-N]